MNSECRSICAVCAADLTFKSHMDNGNQRNWRRLSETFDALSVDFSTEKIISTPENFWSKASTFSLQNNKVWNMILILKKNFTIS